MYSFEIISDLDKIKNYSTEWDRLYNSDEHEASLSYEWTQALLKTHLERPEFHLIILRDSNEIVGIVPLCIREVNKYGFSLLTLMPVAEYFNTHSDLLLKNFSEELFHILLGCIFNLKHKWDVFRINRFIEGNPALDQMTRCLENYFPFKYEIKKAEPSFLLELDSTYGEFLRKRSANLRYKIKNVSKKIYSMGDVSLLRDTDFSNFGDAYKIILSIEEKSWKHKHGTAITSSEKQRRFYLELCGGAFYKKWLRFSILCLNNEPIAFEMGLLKGRKYYGVHGSYDDKFKQINPGTMLLAHFIEELIQNNVREYDWFGEPFGFQSRWTDKFRWHNSLLIYNKNTKARLFYITNKFKNKIRQNISNQIILRDPREIRPSVN